VNDVWTWPARIGVLLGTGLFLALLVPILVIQIRRYGAGKRGLSGNEAPYRLADARADAADRDAARR
jgi:hypothetical protein